MQLEIERVNFNMIAFNLIASHLAGDYLLQNDWMALNKKKSSFACTVHVALYMLGFLLMATFGQMQWWQFWAIAGQHWLQDRTNFVSWYMGAVGQSNFAKAPCAPWSIFVVDNAFHLVFVAIVMQL